MRHEEPEAPENHERWLISYADFITLLMVLFVVLYSMSQVDASKYEQLAQSLNIALTGGTGILDYSSPGIISPDDLGSPVNPTPTPADIDMSTSQTELENMEGLQKKLATYFSDNGMVDSVSMSIDERGLVVSLTDTILFDPGRAVIKAEALNELIAVGQALDAQENHIRVEGHTDNVPISTAQFPSNWELSTQRATNVVRILQDNCGLPPTLLRSTGFGEYQPIGDNTTPEGRQSNRRIDIVITSI